MSLSHVEVAPNFSQPLVFWGVIGTLVAITIGLTLAVIRLHPQSWSWVMEVRTRWMMYQHELHEDDPRQSLHLPVQSPPPSPTPLPSAPIPIPTRNPSLQSFDTFGERLPIRAPNIHHLRKPMDRQQVEIAGQQYV
jgi:hypothetical protein